MRVIEITTTQNVAIEYELASVRDRIIAFIIDFIIIWVGIFILLLLTELAAPQAIQSFLLYIIMVPVFFFYSLVFEILGNGQSFGKKSVGIKVVKINGSEGGVSDYLIRWTFRMVDIYFSLGSVATLLISSTEKAQRLGDLVANTAVIKTKPKNFLRLKDILKINSLQNYVPKYPEIRQMKESEMLIVKKVLDRLKQYPNDAHEEAAEKLVTILCERLGIKETISNHVVFLRTLINDYIVLTR
jgi:uncharacterized RDD family membrane protein YckC